MEAGAGDDAAVLCADDRVFFVWAEFGAWAEDFLRTLIASGRAKTKWASVEYCVEAWKVLPPIEGCGRL